MPIVSSGFAIVSNAGAQLQLRQPAISAANSSSVTPDGYTLLMSLEMFRNLRLEADVAFPSTSLAKTSPGLKLNAYHQCSTGKTCAGRSQQHLLARSKGIGAVGDG